jgi:ATP-dependent DNA helicase RecQ
MARKRPSTVEAFMDVHGVGRQKSADFGEQFVQCIVMYCDEHALTTDVRPAVSTQSARAAPPAAALKAFPLFDEGLSVEDVAERLGRATSTVYGYLEAYIRHRRAIDPVRWVPPHEVEQITAIAQQVGASRLKPIYDALNGTIGYERIRIVALCLENQLAASTERNAT